MENNDETEGENKKNYNDFMGGCLEILLSVSIGVVLGFAGCGILISNTNGTFRRYDENEVEKGYVVPSKLEIKVKDLDGNGIKETTVEYDGQSYLFKLDDSGRPYTESYAVIPARVVPSTQPMRVEAERAK